MIFLVKSRKDPEQKISAWEAQYYEKPHADLILGPFGCLAHLVLQKEHRLARLDPKDDTDGDIVFGVRSIVGVFLGVHVDPVTMSYTYLMTYGKNVYASKNNIITTGDIFPYNITVPQDVETQVVPKACLGEGEELNRETFAVLLLHAKCEGDKYAETVNKQNDTLVFSGENTVKTSKAIEGCNPSIRETKKKVTYFEETAVEDFAVPMENPLLYGDGIADAPELFH